MIDGMTHEQAAKLALDAPHRAQQKWTELAPLLEVLDDMKPKRILELGVFQGGTIRAWTYAASDDAFILGVDLPGGRFGGGFNLLMASNIKALAKRDQKIELVSLDSHEDSTFEAVKAAIGEVDFLFIDADHTYEGVKRDFELYSPLVKAGGIIALHDIVEHTNYHDVKVHVFWNELKGRFPASQIREFIDLEYPTDHGHWGGIGAILV